MPSTREPLVIGPFAGGLNTYDDPTAVRDTELVEALNWDPGLEGSLKSRPPFTDTNTPLTLGATGNAKFLGFYYATNGVTYLIVGDGLNSTWAYDGSTWSLITATISASAMTQFDNKAWMTSPVGDLDPGGYWSPGAGFTPDADMPHGDTIVGFKSRLWISPGKGNANGTRIYYSKVLGQPSFWTTPSFVDVGQGDGQEIVLLATYYNSLVAFRTQSIYNFSFTSDPAQGSVNLLVPNVGLASRDCLISYENYLYFMFDEKAYQFVNNNATQINLKVPFTASNKANISLPYSVSLFNNRAIFHYYDTMYVYSLRTRTWTRWKSPTYGAIGQIFSPAGVLTDEAFVNPSKVLSPPTVLRKNGCTNPVPTTTASYTSPATPSITANGYTLTLSTTATPYIFTAPHSDGMIAGHVYAFRAKTRALPQAGSVFATYSVRPHKNTGNVYWNPVGGIVILPADGLEKEVAFYFVAPVSAPAGEGFNLSLVGAGTGLSGSTMSVKEVLIEDVGTVVPSVPPEQWFSGDTPDTPYLDYAWLGPVNGSASTITSKRVSPLLRIQDRVGNLAENFQCVVQTKNYNYQNSSNFKRLFWWGVDAVFRTKIQAWAVPVVQRSTVTWGQLRAQGITWGALLGGTWGFPLSSASEVKTEYDLGGSGPVRKFVKMFKSLRFRQIYFRVVFDTDGSIGTAPVNLFTITAYVATKETVSKPIS